MQPLRGWLGRRRPLKRRLVRAYRCRRSSARSVLRSPDPRLGGQGNSTRRERHSADQGLPRSANHHSPHRPQLPPSRKGQFEWDAEYVSVRWAVTRRPCVASPGAIAFAGGEAPRRYLFSGFGGSAPPAPNSRLDGDCTDSADRNKAASRGNGRRPDPSRNSDRGEPADLRSACKRRSASSRLRSQVMALA